MAKGWLDIKSAVVADTVYCDGSLVAKDVALTLPGITFQTAEVQSMGAMELPLYHLVEQMDLAITKVGLDLGLAKMFRLGKLSIEVRWVQTATKADGTTKPEGCKAFLSVLPKAVGEIGLEIGESTEVEGTYSTMRYQLYVGGKEILLIDRMAGKLRINGVDYSSEYNSLL